MSDRPYGRGRLTDEDRATIEQLAGRMSAGQIAYRLKKHQSTVAWFMYTHGLKAPKQTDSPASYVRNGRAVRRFSKAEDDRVTALRKLDLNAREIAERINAEFGTARSHHTIRCRLKMLAAIEDEVSPT